MSDAGELHHEALMARLRAHPQYTNAVFDLGSVPTVNPPTRYLVVASSSGDWSQSRATGGKVAVTTSHFVYAVGVNRGGVGFGTTAVTSQMKDHKLAISGRNVFRPDPWISRPTQVDKDGPIKLPFGTISFDITSEPA